MRRKHRHQKTRIQKIGDIQIFRLFVFAATLVLLYLIFAQRASLAHFTKLGYLGIFIVNLIASSTVLLPLPGVASVFLGGAIWNPVLVGFLSGLGATLGEVFGYFLGYGGRGLLPSSKQSSHWSTNIETLFHKAGFVTIFIFSLLPLPVFDVIGIIAGALNYPIWKFTLATFTGRVLRNFLIAWTGAKLIP